MLTGLSTLLLATFSSSLIHAPPGLKRYSAQIGPQPQCNATYWKYSAGLESLGLWTMDRVCSSQTLVIVYELLEVGNACIQTLFKWHC